MPMRGYLIMMNYGTCTGMNMKIYKDREHVNVHVRVYLHELEHEDEEEEYEHE